MRSHFEAEPVLQKLRDRGFYTNLPQTVACTCGRCDEPEDEEPMYYECVGCRRTVPYCFGQDDELFDYCDECAIAMFEIQGEPKPCPN